MLNRGQVVHGAEDDALFTPSVGTRATASRTREQPYSKSGTHTRVAAEDPRDRSRREASALFAETIESAGLSHDTAARVLGIARPILSRKIGASSDKSVSLADVIDLIDGAPDAGEALLRRLQDRVDMRRGVRAPPPEMMMRICLFVVAEMGRLCLEVSLGSVDPSSALTVCAVLHAQIARLESCVRGMAT